MSNPLMAFRSMLSKWRQDTYIDLTDHSYDVDLITGLKVVDVKPLKRAWLCSWANRHSRHFRWMYHSGDIYRLCGRCAASVPLPGAVEAQPPPLELAQVRVSLPVTGEIRLDDQQRELVNT